MFHRNNIAEVDAYRLLGNPRRRETVTALSETPRVEVTLRDLSERVASRETGLDPAPRPHRASVYNALHQTHLPKLHAFGLVEYDSTRKLVRPQPAVRSLSQYMDTVTWFGLSWGEYYRFLGILGLCTVVAALAGVPVVSALDPLIVASATLAVFAISTCYQLRGAVARLFSGLRT
jgi:hypothetical protein